MAVKQKLRSRRGATLMAALLFFLVAAVCGSIILAAATATASRVKNQAKDAQAYYAVTSAAQLIRDDLMDSNWLITLEEQYEDNKIKSGFPSIKDIQLVDKDLKELSNEDLQKTFVRDLFVKSVDNGNSFVTNGLIKIMTTEVKNFPTVFCRASGAELTKQIGEQSSNLTIIITNNTETDTNKKFHEFKETDAEGNQLYWVTVSLRSVKIPSGFQILNDGRNDSGTGTVTRTVCLTWRDPVIEKVRVS